MENQVSQASQPEMNIMPLDVAIYAQHPGMSADMDSLLSVSMYIYLRAKRERQEPCQMGTMIQR